MDGTELDGLPPLPDDQPLIGVSMESDANYPLQADAAFVDRFDILAGLAPSADVWSPYYDDAAYRGCWTHAPPPRPPGAATRSPTSTQTATRCPGATRSCPQFGTRAPCPCTRTATA